MRSGAGYTKDCAYSVVRDIARGGNMVIAGKPLAPGDLAAVAYLYSIQRERDNQSIEVAPGIHARVTAPGMVFNHSCEPNLGIEIVWGTGAHENFHLVWRALRPILPGEELTWDYGTTESECISVPVCRCGAPSCRGRAIGKNERGAAE